MSFWWYVEGREVNGPCSLNKLNGLLKDHRLMPQTWVWSQELVRWTQAKDVPALTAAHGPSASDDYTDLSTIDLPVPDPEGPQRPGPWTRWIVQYADLQLISVLLYLLIWLAGHAVTLPDLSATWLQWVINLILVAFGLWVQGLMIGRFGTTPFKRMVGIRIETVDGSPLTQTAVHRRQVGLWWRGMGLGLPIVEIVTNIIAFIPVSAGRRTDWDQAAGLDVRQSRHRPEILLLVVLTSFMLFYFNMLLVQHMSTLTAPAQPPAGAAQPW